MTDLLETPLHRLDPTRVPVLLLGGLNLVRSLGLAGIEAIVATSDIEEPALHSRYCTVRALIPPAAQHDARVDAIASLGERLAGLYGRRVPLMYGSDDALELIYAHRDRLSRYFLFLLCDPDVAESLLAKDRFQTFAEERALPVPRALAWAGTGPGSLAAFAREVAIKPRAKRDWHQSTLCQRLFDGDGKAIVLPNGAAALAHPVVAHYCEQLTFQEYIPGDDTCLWSFHGFADEKGQVVDAFTGRKIRTYPVGVGESAFIELAGNPELDAIARDVVQRAGLKGPFKIDFKHDARDGRWYALEINARYTLWEYVAAANGVNLLRTAYDYLLDRQRTRFPAPAGNIRWLNLPLDLKACRELRARGEITWARWIASIVASRNLCNVFSWSDPLPFLQDAASRVLRKARRAPGQVLNLLRQKWASTAS